MGYGLSENTRQKFTGYERDSESNSDYAVNRQYASGVARFSRPDPLAGKVV
jgi:RHS repeat-associated protein